MYKLVISSPNIEALLESTTKFFYFSNIRFEGDKVYNSKGLIEGFRVAKKGNRYRLEMSI